MASKKHNSPPPWARRRSTDLSSPPRSISNPEATMTDRKDGKLDEAVNELARWWKDDLADEEYYPRVKKIVDICHAQQPGYEQVKQFEAKFRSVGATQEHINMVLGDLEPHWTQAILTHVAKTATSPHGIASVIRIMLAETERLHGQVIDKTSHDELIRVVNRFDPPPPMMPSLSGPQRPQLQIDVSVVKQSAEDMFMTPSSAVSSVLQKQLHSEAPTTSTGKPSPTSSLSHNNSSDPRRLSSSSTRHSAQQEVADHQDRREGITVRGRASKNTSNEAERAPFVFEGRVPERFISSNERAPEQYIGDRVPDRPIPDRPRLDREREAAKAAREYSFEQRGKKRKVSFDDEDRIPTEPRRRPSERDPSSYASHETKVHLPTPLINKHPAYINDEISLACERSGLRITTARPHNDHTWILNFGTVLDQREAIGRSISFHQKSVVVQAISPPTQHFQIYVAHVPTHVHADGDALQSIARRFSHLNFALLLQTKAANRSLKWVICLETPIDAEIVNIGISQKVCTFYALPSYTERCFVCRVAHSCLRCSWTKHYAKRPPKDCPQYLEYVPDIISRDIVP